MSLATWDATSRQDAELHGSPVIMALVFVDPGSAAKLPEHRNEGLVQKPAFAEVTSLSPINRRFVIVAGMRNRSDDCRLVRVLCKDRHLFRGANRVDRSEVASNSLGDKRVRIPHIHLRRPPHR